MKTTEIVLPCGCKLLFPATNDKVLTMSVTHCGLPHCNYPANSDLLPFDDLIAQIKQIFLN